MPDSSYDPYDDDPDCLTSEMMEELNHEQELEEAKKNAPICPYCGNRSKLVLGSAIYGEGYPYSKFLYYFCKPCGAYVGTHAKSFEPYGTLANAELRKARNKAHAAFDPFWKNHLMSRKRAYGKLSHAMRIPFDKCHIGMFTVEQCELCVKVSNAGLKRI